MNEVWAKDEVWGLDHLSLGNVTNGTLNLEHYLLQKRGPKHLSLTVVVPITIVYTAIFVSGVIGNVATCIVIITNTNLHTATNYYLFSLAVSDLTLLLLGLPNDLSVFWQQYPWQLGEPLCKLRALISEMTSYTSVLTIVAFSMERYLAICHPLFSYTMAGLRRAVRIVAVLWVLSFFGALPFSVFTKVNYITFPPDSDNIVEESAFCGLLEENMPQHFPIYELSFFIFFFMPLSVIVLLYSLIGLQIRTKTLGKRVVGTIHGDTKKFQSRKSIIRMLVAVVVTFFLCWAPYHAQRLYYFYGRGSEYYYLVNEWLYYIAGCFYYFSATANPLLYNLMSVKYRNGFRRTFCGRRRREYSSTSGKVRRQPSVFKSEPGEPDKLLQEETQHRRCEKLESRYCCNTTVTTKTCQWPHTRLSVTIDRADNLTDTSSPTSISVQMETQVVLK